jgi:hypothetical protein
LQQIADMLENKEFWENFDVNNHSQYTYIEPPGNRKLSDEDSADDVPLVLLKNEKD